MTSSFKNFFSVSHTTHQSVGLLWTSDQLVAETSDNTQHSRQTSMLPPPSVEFEPTISADERPQTYALHSTATETGSFTNSNHNYYFEINLKIKFHDNPSCGNRAVPCGLTDGDTTNLVVAFHNSANAPKKKKMQPVERTTKNHYRKSGDIWHEASVLQCTSNIYRADMTVLF
jgi:hypothetical protein